MRIAGIACLGIATGIVVGGCSNAESRATPDDRKIVATPASPQAVVLAPEDADRFWVFPESPEDLGSGGEFHVFVDPVTFPEARASFSRFALGPGGALPTHRHDKTEEIAYILSGEGTFTVFEGDEPMEIPIRAGHVVYNPPGAWHAIRTTGDEPLALVFAVIPNEERGLLSFFRRIGVKPGEETEPLTPEEFARVAAEHDLLLRPAAEASP